jgi:hypothetical protein
MSARSRVVAESRFSCEKMVSGYLDVFRSLEYEPQPDMDPRPLSEFQLNRAFYTPGWKRRIPGPFRAALKRSLYHLGWSDRYE